MSQKTEVIAASWPLTLDEARDLTEEVKADAAALWAKLLTLYEGAAHTALGYSSWADYCAEEFDFGKSQSYRVLEAARVVAALRESPIGERPATESVARELVPVLRETPNDVEQVWGDVVAEHGPAPTAKQVRDVVQAYRPTRRPLDLSEVLVAVRAQTPVAVVPAPSDATMSLLRDVDEKTGLLMRSLEGLSKLPSAERGEARRVLTKSQTMITEILKFLTMIERLEAKR